MRIQIWAAFLNSDPCGSESESKLVSLYFAPVLWSRSVFVRPWHQIRLLVCKWNFEFCSFNF